MEAVREVQKEVNKKDKCDNVPEILASSNATVKYENSVSRIILKKKDIQKELESAPCPPYVKGSSSSNED